VQEAGRCHNALSASLKPSWKALRCVPVESGAARAEDVIAGEMPKWSALHSELNIVDLGEAANNFLHRIGASRDVSADHVVKVCHFFTRMM
jgi:hypothetical protein